MKKKKELASHLVKCAEIGYPKTKDEVIGIVRKALLKKRGKEFAEDFKGKGWWARYMTRWPELALRRGDALAVACANAVTAANLKEYYDLLKTTLEEHGIMNLPSRIYNMDETGMPLDHKPPKVVARKGMKKVHCRTSGNKGQITILACSNAAGSVIPPMVIFEGQRFNPEWSKGEVPDTLYGMSERGWTDQEMFFFWMTELFVKHIPPVRPVLLLVDGHSSHYEPDTIRAAAEQGIVIFCHPPHCTHVAQPLDVSFFRPLKVYWSEVCHTFMQENPGSVITKYQFSALFSKAWYKAIQPQNLIAGFTKCGIYPYNSDAIKPTIYTPEEEDEDGIDEQKMDETSINNHDGVEMDSGNNSMNATSDVFSPEQIALFELLNEQESGLDLQYTTGDIPEYASEASVDEPNHNITKDIPFQSTTCELIASSSTQSSTSPALSLNTSTSLLPVSHTPIFTLSSPSSVLSTSKPPPPVSRTPIFTLSTPKMALSTSTSPPPVSRTPISTLSTPTMALSTSTPPPPVSRTPISILSTPTMALSTSHHLHPCLVLQSLLFQQQPLPHWL